jgi:hypothetical protein
MVAIETVISYLLGVVSGAGGIMVADWFKDYRNRLKTHVEFKIETPIITSTKVQILIGFGISVEQGEALKGAYIRCNGQIYPWYEEGSLKDKTILPVGEQPKWFSPYSVIFEYIDDISAEKTVEPIHKKQKQSNHGILLTVQDRKTNSIVFSQFYSTPTNVKSFKSMTNKLLFPLSIRLIAEEGIRRKWTYEGEMHLTRFDVHKVDNGVASLDTLTPYFTLAYKPRWL